MSYDEHEENCLFVGGPHDGEWHKVRTAQEIWELAEHVPLKLPIPSPFTVADFTVRKRSYVRTPWRADWNLKYIYRSVDLDVGDVLSRLLRGYRGSKQ